MSRALMMVLALLVALASQQSSAQQCSVHTFIADSPSDAQPGWHDEAQGLAHDRDHWFVTQNNGDKTEAVLWRIPVETNLASGVSCGSGGVSCSRLTETGLYPIYDHYGDPDYYEFNGRGYVLVAVEGKQAGTPPGVFIFRADATLEWRAFTPFPGQTGAPWVAVDSDGILYSSDFQTGGVIHRYLLDWAAFQANDERLPLAALTPLEPMLLEYENGAPLSLVNVQGGEFSDDMRRLYVSSGNGTGDPLPIEGLHVLRVQDATGRECGSGAGPCTIAQRIERSHNSDNPGFSFEFHPGLPEYQEPEGLTFWDLDADGRAPGVRGQLHVVLLDNNFTLDEVYVKHYRFDDLDTEPPVMTCPAPVVVECSSPGGVSTSDPRLAPFFAGASAIDACTLQPQITHNAPAVFPLGTTTSTFTATDGSGNASTCQSTVAVVDTTPPTISVTLSPDVLWPANHQLVPVTAHVTVADSCGSPTFELVSISSNEPDDGTGDGHTSDDIQGAAFGTSDTSFLLRAERSGSGRGREYTVVYRAIDGSGQTQTATAVVRVPHAK